jgi:hypothetical protein
MVEHTSGLTLQGLLCEEGPEAVTLKIGHSLFEIQRSYVEHLREVEEAEGGKVVEVKIFANAQMIQRVLAPAATLVMTIPILCNCDCVCAQCNQCACECTSPLRSLPERSSFRSRLRGGLGGTEGVVR